MARMRDGAKALEGRILRLALRGRTGAVDMQLPRGVPARILAVRLDEIGDFVLGSPFLFRLRRAFPKARITLVVKPGLAALARSAGVADEVLAFPQDHPARLWLLAESPRLERFAAAELAPRRFDLAIHPRSATDYYGAGLMVRRSGAPLRLGFRAAEGNPRRRLDPWSDLCYTHLVSRVGGEHQAEECLRLLAPFGLAPSAPALRGLDAPADRRAAAKWWRRLGGGRKWIAVLPWGSLPSKSWGLERYAELGRSLEGSGYRLLILGGEEHRAPGEALAGRMGAGAASLAGRCGLGVTQALLRRCSLYVGADSGPAHLAAAVGKPCVVLTPYAPGRDGGGESAPDRFRPWGVPSEVLGPPAGMPLAALEPRDVAAAVGRLLPSAKGSR